MAPEEDTITEEPGQSNHNQPQTGIMSAKLLAEEIVKLLSFSDTERKQVEGTTTKQWQCEGWYPQKTSAKEFSPPGNS